MAWARQASVTLWPASTPLRMLIICSSLNLDLRMMGSPRRLVYERTLIIAAPLLGEEVISTRYLSSLRLERKCRKHFCLKFSSTCLCQSPNSVCVSSAPENFKNDLVSHL